MKLTVFRNMKLSPSVHLTSVAVFGGLVVDIGKTEDLDRKYALAEQIDLESGFVLPAFIDAHTHFLQHCLKQEELDFNGISSMEACLKLVKQQALQLPAGSWIKGSGWNQNVWLPALYPSRHDLDKVAPNNPVCLDARDAHTSWVNSRALELAGITSQTVFGNDGEIIKSADGQPTGIIKEEARRLVWDVWDKPSIEDRAHILRKYQSLAFQNGLCSIHCMESIDDFEAYQFLNAKGDLDIRVTFYFPVRYLDHLISLGLKSGFGDDRLRIGGVKIFLDGTLGSRTAHMIDVYEKSDTRGMDLLDEKSLDEVVLRASEHGIACAVHAIGDMANRKALNAFQKTLMIFPNHGLRHRIEHCQLLHPSDIPRFAQLDVIASMQAIHIPEDIDTADQHWGQRARYAFPFQSLRKAGARLAFGSDVPIETCNVFQGTHAALKRSRRNDPRSWHPEECLTIREVVEAYTSGAAYAAGTEQWQGRLDVGKWADFMVVSNDLFTCSPEEIPDIRVSKMIVGGRVVYAP